MLVLLLVVSVLVNVALVTKVVEMKKEKAAVKVRVKKVTRDSKVVYRGLLKVVVVQEKRVKSLEEQIKEMNERLRRLEERVEELEDVNSAMYNNIYTLMKQGRIIKSKYNNQIFTYRWDKLLDSEWIQFFGNIIKTI